MFLTLGLLVFPSSLADVALEGTVIALVAAAFARPLAVVVALPFGGYPVRERHVLGWAGLRGAVPIVLATFPVIDGAVRRLGAEVRQFAVGPNDAIVGHPVRDIGLPREALLNLVVRGEQAIPPR